MTGKLTGERQCQENVACFHSAVVCTVVPLDREDQEEKMEHERQDII